MATGAIVAGTAITAYGKYQSAQDSADAMEGQAAASEAEADELMRRAYINAGATKREGEDLKNKQVSSFVSAGVEIGEGTPLTVLEDTNEKIARQVGYDMEAASFTAEQKRRSAAFARSSASATRSAGILAAVGTGVSGGAKAYDKAYPSE